MKKRILSVITCLALCLSLLPSIPSSAAAAEASVSDEAAFLAALQNPDVSTITLTAPITLSKPSSGGDDALLVGRTGSALTIQGQSLTVLHAGIILGGDVTFRNISINFINPVRNAIIANGHALTLDNVTGGDRSFGIHLFCGGISGYIGYNPEEIAAATPGTRGHITIQGSGNVLGDIFAGSLSDVDKDSANVGNTFQGASTITVDKGSAGSTIGAIYAYGAREDRSGSYPEDWLPNAALYTVSGGVTVELKDTPAKTVYGTSATTVQYTDDGKGNSFAPALYGIGGVGLHTGLDSGGQASIADLAPAAGSTLQNAAVALPADTRLTLTSLTDVETIASLSGGGTLVMDQYQALTITGEVTGQTKVAVGGVSYDRTNSTAEPATGHTYIAAERSADGAFELLPTTSFPDKAFQRSAAGGWSVPGGTAAMPLQASAFAFTETTLAAASGTSSVKIPLTVTYVNDNGGFPAITDLSPTVWVNGSQIVGVEDASGYYEYTSDALGLSMYFSEGEYGDGGYGEFLYVAGFNYGALTDGAYSIAVTIPAANTTGGTADITSRATLTVGAATAAPALTTLELRDSGDQPIHPAAIPAPKAAETGDMAYTIQGMDQTGADFDATGAAWAVKTADGQAVTGVSVAGNAAKGRLTVTHDAINNGFTGNQLALTITATPAGGSPVELNVTLTREDSAPAAVEVSGGVSGLTVPTVATPADIGNTVTGTAASPFTATVRDQYGQVMSGQTVSWTAAGNSGVTIDSSGLLTVTNHATADTVTVTAACGGPTGTQTVAVSKAAPAATWAMILKDGGQTSADTISIPGSGSVTRTYTARFYDQYGGPIAATPVWTLVTGPANVTQADGTLTVPANAGTGTATLKAASGNASETVIVTISAKPAHTVGDFASAGIFAVYGDPVTGQTVSCATGPVTYTSDKPDVVAVDPSTGALTTKGVGDATITAAVAETDTYGAVTKSYAVMVTPRELTITGLSATGRAYEPGNTAVTLTGGALNGVIPGDDVSVTMPAAGTIAAPGAGNGKAVAVDKPALTGTRAGNYTLADLPAITVDIAKATPVVGTVSYTGGDIFTSTPVADVNSALARTDTSVAGALALDAASFTATGTGSYGWTFTPADGNNYSAATGTVSLTVRENALTGITLDTEPAKKAYVYGDAFDTTGLKVTAAFANGDTLDVTDAVTLTLGGAAIANGDTISAVNEAGAAVTVSYTSGGVTETAQFTVTVGKASVDASAVAWDYTGPFTFDGSAKTVALTNVPAGLTVTYGGAVTAADAGSYRATAALALSGQNGYTGANYQITGAAFPAEQAWEIGKGALTPPVDITAAHKYDVTDITEPAIGGRMPANAGALAYGKGVTVTTGGVSVTGWSVDSGGNLTATLSGGGAGDTITFPVIITSSNYQTVTVNVVITLTDKSDQAALTVNGVTATYGTDVTLSASGGSGTGAVTWSVTDGSGGATVSGNVLTPTRAGTVTVVATKAGDGTYNEAHSAPLEITIGKATPTGAPKYTAITASGKRLSDAGLTTTGGSFSVSGSVSWELADTTTVAANTPYKWVFTPADSGNYNQLTGSVTLYYVSAGGGSYVPPYSPGVSGGGIGGGAGTSADVVTQNGQTTARPAASISGTTASASLSSLQGSQAVQQAVQSNSGEVVIAPQVNSYVDRTVVSLPASTLGDIRTRTDADLTVSTPVAGVSIPNGGLGRLTYAGGTVTVSAQRQGNTVTLDITAGGAPVRDIPGGITLTVPYGDCGPGTVAVLIQQSGTRIVRKSVADEGALTVTIPLEGSARLMLVDNGRSFADVHASAWYADAVAFVTARGLYNGVSEGRFSPETAMTRGMVAKVLHNLEENPSRGAGSGFLDVDFGAWYESAVLWASERGIVTGYGSGLFGPNDPISREQLAVMLWRYAGSPAGNHSLGGFRDVGQISGYALEAMRWAVEQGVITGKPGGVLDPTGPAKRSEGAQMLKNFLESTVD